MEEKEKIVNEVIQTTNVDIDDTTNLNKENIQKESLKEKLKLEESFKALGIEINDENKRIVLDYSRTISNFKKLLDAQKNNYVSLKNYMPDNEVVTALINELNKNWEEISKYFETLMSFFINPPSKEIFELTNHALLLKNIYNSLKEFSEDFAKLHIEEQFNGIKNDFEQNLKTINEYQNKLAARLENMAQTYDEFLNKFLDKQTNELDNFNKKSAELAKSYDDFLHKNLKFFKGGTWSLIILNIALAISLGVLTAICFIKNNELNSLIEVGKKFAEISVKQDEQSITLNFPLDAKFISDNNEKKVILKQ